LDVIDDGSPARQTARYFASQRPFVLAGNRAPKKNLATSHDNPDLGRIDLTVLVHVLFNPAAQLKVRWGNLARCEVILVVINVHAPETLQITCLGHARHTGPLERATCGKTYQKIPIKVGQSCTADEWHKGCR
jgi:hypothetical protein